MQIYRSFIWSKTEICYEYVNNANSDKEGHPDISGQQFILSTSQKFKILTGQQFVTYIAILKNLYVTVWNIYMYIRL